jgi:DNA-binding transcriptional ArsR family regulator
VPKSVIPVVENTIADDLIEQVSGLLKALSTPIRLRIICELCNEEKSVSELIDIVGVRQTLVSQQLAVLRDQRIISSRKQGTRVIYRIADKNVALIINSLCQIYKE